MVRQEDVWDSGLSEIESGKLTIVQPLFWTSQLQKPITSSTMLQMTEGQ